MFGLRNHNGVMMTKSGHFAASTKGGSVLWRRNWTKWSREMRFWTVS